MFSGLILQHYSITCGISPQPAIYLAPGAVRTIARAKETGTFARVKSITIDTDSVKGK